MQVHWRKYCRKLFSPAPSAILLPEKRRDDRTRARVRADYAADLHAFRFRKAVFPQRAAVLDVFFQKHVGHARITQQHGQLKIHAAAFLNLFHQQIVALLRAACLADQRNRAVFNRNNRLDIQKRARCGHSFGNASAAL